MKGMSLEELRVMQQVRKLCGPGPGGPPTPTH